MGIKNFHFFVDSNMVTGYIIGMKSDDAFHFPLEVHMTYKLLTASLMPTPHGLWFKFNTSVREEGALFTALVAVKGTEVTATYCHINEISDWVFIEEDILKANLGKALKAYLKIQGPSGFNITFKG